MFLQTSTKLWYKLLRNPFQQAASTAFTCTDAISTNRCVWLSMYSCMRAGPTIQLAKSPPAQLFFHGKILLLLQIKRQGGTTEGSSSPSHVSQHLRTFGEVFAPESKITFSQVQLDRQFDGSVLCFGLQGTDKSHIHSTFTVWIYSPLQAIWQRLFLLHPWTLAEVGAWDQTATPHSPNSLPSTLRCKL